VLHGWLISFLDERFVGGRAALAAGLMQPQGAPGGEFTAALLDPYALSLGDIPLTNDPSEEHLAQIAEVFRRRSPTEIMQALAGLPWMERPRSTWYLTGIRVKMRARALTAGHSDALWAASLTNLDTVLEWLYGNDALQTSDASTLSAITVTPQPLGGTRVARRAIPPRRSWADLPARDLPEPSTRRE
jgi:hypothetical protein